MSSDDTGATMSLPQPDQIAEREKEDAMAAYLMMFASIAIGLPIPLVNLVASVIYYLVNRKSSRFVAFHCLQALLTHLPVVFLNAAIVGWLIGILVTQAQFGPAFFWFLFFVGLANVAYIVWSIIALVHARKGRLVYMPLVGRYCFSRYYGPKAEERSAPRAWENKPPEGM
jgi:uncharacterized membrane protein